MKVWLCVHSKLGVEHHRQQRHKACSRAAQYLFSHVLVSCWDKAQGIGHKPFFHVEGGAVAVHAMLPKTP
jgi:hypothetical protein